jgi:hypothetical protein
MLSRSAALFLAINLALSSAAHASTERQAWFYSSGDLRRGIDRWCSFVTKGSADAAAKSDEFDGYESAWMRYRGNRIVQLIVSSQSEDAYVEDTYTFGPDLSLKQLVRRGHYISDRFISAVFTPDDRMRLRMTPQSRRLVGRWGKRHATYFFDWPIYPSFSKLPFAGLIRTKPSISVSQSCQASSSTAA